MQQNDQEIPDELNTFFKNSVLNLEINENLYITNQVSDDILDPVENCIDKYQFHPSFYLLRIGLTFKICFHSMPCYREEGYDERTFKYWSKKATTGNSIPSKTLKLSAEISADVLQNLFNEMLSTGHFPDNMKLVDIAPVFKKKRPFKKRSDRPASALSAISNIFEKLM